MDENAQSPNPNPQGNQPVAAQNPLMPPQGSVASSASQQNIPSQPQETSSSTAAGSSRLTLEDLYGPSQPHELPPAGEQNPSQMGQPQLQMPQLPVGEQISPTPQTIESNVPSGLQSPVIQQSAVSSIVPPLAQPSTPAEEFVSPTPPASPVAQASNIPNVQEQSPTAQEVSVPTVPDTNNSESQDAQAGTRRQADGQPVSGVSQPLPSVAHPSEPKEEIEQNTQGKGFPIATALRFVIGGVIILIIILIIWAIGSMIFSQSNSQSGNVSLTYWGLWEDPRVMQPILDDFHKQHPNITVTYTMEDPKDYTKRLLTRAQDGTGPDIFRFHNTWMYPLQSLLLPLPTSVIDKQTVSSDYPPVVTHDLIQNGALYGLPLQMDTLTLFVNSDIFAHAGASIPTTWDNFITVAKALTVKDPSGKIQTAGAAIGSFDNVNNAPDIISLLLLQNGANLNKLNPSQNANDALTFYSSFAKPDGNVWDNTLDNSLKAFAAGKVAMYFGYSYDIFSIKALAPSLNFKTYPVPHLPGRNITIASYWVEGISDRSKHQKEALEFMQYLAQKNVQQKLYTEEANTRSFGELYARTDLADQLKANPLLAPFVMQYANATSSFFSDNTDYDEYNGALNQYLGNAIKSMVQDTSVDSATQTLSQGVSQVMNTYGSKTP